ncbi:substrate-binding periplasmic protein [Motilimonas eburnea]|uniref:substrate-binding periplasmic protein n=1 Tax=Motilimonas eburnea TaxID=1737488 RepID=UPI001E5769D3|nr:transporter substrate-binding domain-containing protein [Motilimonas eburnea]MCE2572728.1 transporter substrate-binding domain-containing protein [Motilimonas eburnea]
MKLSLMLLGSLCWSLSVLAQPVLIVNYGPSDNAPYIIEQANGEPSGVIVELMQEFAVRSGIEVTFLKTPRKRLEFSLETGKVHIVVTSNPKWLKQPDKVKWTIPLFIEKNILVIPKTAPDIVKLDDLKGLSIGTVLGYAYPEIAPLFANGEALRVDALEVLQSLQKMQVNRIDAVITSDIQGEWLLKHHGFDDDFVFARFLISEHEIIPAISNLSPVSVEKFNRVFLSMQQDGFIERLLNRYRQ